MILKWLNILKKSRRMNRRVWITVTLVCFGMIFISSMFLLNKSNSSQVYINDKNHAPVYVLHTANDTYIYPKHFLRDEDYTSLIDLNNFKFDILSNCTHSTFLLILVHSAVRHRSRRNSIRDTWGNQLNKNIKMVFVIGKVIEHYFQIQLEEEQTMYKDIIQGNFLDVYRNMTYKHTMSLKYPIYHCPQAKYILKVDDDVFVHIPVLLNFLNAQLSPYGVKNLLFCVPVLDSPVKRSYRSKWRVSYNEYSEEYFPTYCPGWALLYSPDVLFTLYKAVQKSKYFWIDDVLVTGILAKQENILHTNMQLFVLPMEILEHDIFERHNYNGTFIFSSPNLQVKDMYNLWNFIQNCTTRDCLYLT